MADQKLNFATILIRTRDVRPDGLRDLYLLQMLSPPKLTLSRVALIVPDADRVAPAGQEKIVDALLAMLPDVPWLVTAADHRNLNARFKLALLAYLGLGPNGRMRFLSQSG